MRTKTLLLTAACGLAGITSSLAQVYSANIVGYISVPVAAGYNLIANQLTTGTNRADQVLPQIPDSAQVLTWNGAGYNLFIYDTGFGGWVNGSFTPVTPPTLDPGRGFFYYNPGGATNVTLVGEVASSPATNALPAGYTIVSTKIPLSGALTAAPVNLPVIDSMQVLKWTGSGYNLAIYDSGFGGWVNGNFQPIATPTVVPGNGFFFYNPGGTTNWVETIP